MTAAIMFSWRRRKGRPNDSSVSASSTSRCSSSTTSSGTPSSGVPSDGCSCVSQTDCLCPGGAASPGGSGSPSGRTMCASSSSDVLSCASSTASLPACLTSAFRWSLDYDLCVCHSVQDHSEALRMVTYLEAKVRNLRCYLLPRDCPLGGAVSTELYSAVHSSHCWVLLISSHFLQDEWCLYQMQQALMEGPMAGRIIPTKLHLPFSECPKELCFYFIIDLGQDTCHGYDKVYKAVLQYLKSGLEKDESKSIVSTSHPNKGKFSSLNGTLHSHPRSTTMQQQSTDTSSEKGNIMN